jgi:transcriptional regulator NrdR family protein
MPKTRKRNLETDGEKLGLVCRSCGCQHFNVVYVKPLRNGLVLRRRECRYCGRRVTTREEEA